MDCGGLSLAHLGALENGGIFILLEAFRALRAQLCYGLLYFGSKVLLELQSSDVVHGYVGFSVADHRRCV